MIAHIMGNVSDISSSESSKSDQNIEVSTNKVSYSYMLTDIWLDQIFSPSNYRKEPWFSPKWRENLRAKEHLRLVISWIR